MSKICFYGLRDVLTNGFPFYFHAVNDDDAKRTLSQLLKNPQHPVSQIYKDLVLFCISEFDEQSYTSQSVLKSVCPLSELSNCPVSNSTKPITLITEEAAGV